MKFVFVLITTFCYTLFTAYGINLPRKDNTCDQVFHDIQIKPVKSDLLTFNPDKTCTISSLKTQSVDNENKNPTLKFDHRYVVYEYIILKNGTTNPKQVAILKSMKAPKSSVGPLTYENLAAFYQISGKKIEIGHTHIKSRRDLGLNLIAGNTFSGLAGTTGRIEYYLSRTMGDMVLPGKTGKGLTSFKVYFEGGQRKKFYSLDGAQKNFTFTRGSFGINKDYYPLRFLHWGPFIGYGMEFAKWENSENLISTNFAEFGARLGINLRHNIQIIGSATYYLLINSVLMDGNRNVIEPNFDYFHTFQNRTGMGFNIGLRLML